MCLRDTAHDVPCTPSGAVGESTANRPLLLQLSATSSGVEVWKGDTNSGDASGNVETEIFFPGSLSASFALDHQRDTEGNDDLFPDQQG